MVTNSKGETAVYCYFEKSTIDKTTEVERPSDDVVELADDVSQLLTIPRWRLDEWLVEACLANNKNHHGWEEFERRWRDTADQHLSWLVNYRAYSPYIAEFNVVWVDLTREFRLVEIGHEMGYEFRVWYTDEVVATKVVTVGPH